MNSVKGVISKIESDSFLSIITVKTDIGDFSVVLLETPETADYMRVGKNVNLLFKETEVEIFKNCSFLKESFLNMFDAQVESVENGKILSKILLRSGNNIFYSVIPKKSVDLLDLKQNDDINFLVRPNEITVEVL
ncbi:hypothetical protein [Persephonella sp.]